MPIGTAKSTIAKVGRFETKWHHADATDQVLGRLASKIAKVLMGKHKPIYTPYLDTGDFVIVTNAAKLSISNKKLDSRVYARYSYYPGGYKEDSMRDVFEKRPERVIEAAVRRMLPKSALGRKMFKKLKVYRGAEHPHAAQNPIQWAY